MTIRKPENKKLTFGILNRGLRSRSSWQPFFQRSGNKWKFLGRTFSFERKSFSRRNKKTTRSSRSWFQPQQPPAEPRLEAGKRRERSCEEKSNRRSDLRRRKRERKCEREQEKVREQEKGRERALNACVSVCMWHVWLVRAWVCVKSLSGWQSKLVKCVWVCQCVSVLVWV